MNCENFEEIVNELARNHVVDRMGDARLRSAAFEHLDQCAICDHKAREASALTLRLDELSRDMKLMSAPENVPDQLRLAFRTEYVNPVLLTTFNDRQVIPRFRSRNGWLAVAAVLLIVLGLAGLVRYVTRYSEPVLVVSGSGTSGDATTGSVAAVVSSSPNKKPAAVRSLAGTRKSTRPRTHLFRHDANITQQTTAQSNAASSKSEIATGFMPLAYAAPMNPLEGGQLVRVEMSRSAMVSMGLPVNMDRYSETVKADVLFGADGFARAIRFVQ